MKDSDVEGYELLDSGAGRKLERFGNLVLARPCAQAAWRPQLSRKEWDMADAAFDREDGSQWHGRDALPESWVISIDGIKFILSGTDFGHLGIFPEQRAQWMWMREAIRAAGRPISLLNLFAYSGGSTLSPAAAGASVCHLDASHGMVDWARENARENGLEEKPIRWMVDDVQKFLAREARRDRKYDAIVLDPPTFGRGKKGEVFKIESDLEPMLQACRQLLSEQPLFVLLSAHTPGYSPKVLENIMRRDFGMFGQVDAGEMLLTGSDGVLPVPSGAFARASCKS